MFSERLKMLRKSRGITQEQLASIINVERSSIGKYEGKSQVIPSMDVILRIANYFNVSADYLLGRSDSVGLIQSEKESNELWDLREKVRRDPETRMLFSLTKNATKDDVLACVALLKGLRAQRGEPIDVEDDDDD